MECLPSFGCSHFRKTPKYPLRPASLYHGSGFLTEFLAGHNVADSDASRILAYQKAQRGYIEEILQRETITEEIPVIDSEEFGQYPVSLSLSGMFYDRSVLQL